MNREIELLHAHKDFPVENVSAAHRTRQCKTLCGKEVSFWDTILVTERLVECPYCKDILRKRERERRNADEQ